MRRSEFGILTIMAALLLAGCAQTVAPKMATSPTTREKSDWRQVNDRLFSGEARDVQQLATRAYVWGMPLVAAAQIRANFSAPNGDSPGVPINRFTHRRKLAGPEMRVGVGPNNDTIYSLAWLDLSDGPLILTTPDFGKRYYTFSINLGDTSAAQSLGQRTHGSQMPPLFIHGPGYNGPVPADMVDVPSTTRYVNLAGRILVGGPEEYALVHALQDRIALTSWADWQAGRHVPPAPKSSRPLSDPARPVPEELRFFDMLGRVMQDWVAQPHEVAMIRSLDALGISTAHGFEPARLSPQARIAIIAGLAEGQRLVRERSLQLGVQQNGWTTNYAGPRFGDDYLLRAGVAKDQIYVAIPEEAVYPIGRIDAQGHQLNGGGHYRIHFAPDQLPPVHAFWSITAYDDTGFMMPNPINRYSVGDRTHGLIKDCDGGVTIILSADTPATGQQVNWLPVVSGQPFFLMMRLYQPKAEILERRWMPPPIEVMH